jgi:hypothetical protein
VNNRKNICGGALLGRIGAAAAHGFGNGDVAGGRAILGGLARLDACRNRIIKGRPSELAFIVRMIAYERSTLIDTRPSQYTFHCSLATIFVAVMDSTGKLILRDFDLSRHSPIRWTC